jgi:hypothetical protein
MTPCMCVHTHTQPHTRHTHTHTHTHTRAKNTICCITEFMGVDGLFFLPYDDLLHATEWERDTEGGGGRGGGQGRWGEGGV